MEKFVRVWAYVGLALCLSFTAGCGYREPDLPAEDLARRALEKALQSWQSGKAPSKIEDGSLNIQVSDQKWQKGLKLLSFEIIGSEKKEGPRWFAVKLNLEEQIQDPEEETTTTKKTTQQVSYGVLGVDPLQVFSEEDYKQMQTWGESE